MGRQIAKRGDAALDRLFAEDGIDSKYRGSEIRAPKTPFFFIIIVAILIL